MRLMLFSLLLLIATGCASTSSPTTAGSIETRTDVSTSEPTLIHPTATPAPDEAFVGVIYQRLDVDDTIPASARQAVISLYQNRPTALFPDNDGLVLIYEVPAVPGSQAETMQAAVMLIGTAVGVAGEHGVLLRGIEVIFYANTEPFIGFRAEPPWSVEDILAAPMSGRLIEEIEGKDGAVTVTPTPTATPEGMRSG